MTKMEFETIQEVFDFVVVEAFKQKKKAYREDQQTCAYRSVRGDGTTLKCFVGFLISDEKYDEELEAYQPSQLIDEEIFSIAEEGLYDENGEYCSAGSVLIHLQSVHDENEPNEWYESLEEFAENRCLRTNVLEQYANTARGPEGAPGLGDEIPF